jgi:hypothetical protein
LSARQGGQIDLCLEARPRPAAKIAALHLVQLEPLEEP